MKEFLRPTGGPFIPISPNSSIPPKSQTRETSGGTRLLGKLNKNVSQINLQRFSDAQDPIAVEFVKIFGFSDSLEFFRIFSGFDPIFLGFFYRFFRIFRIFSGFFSRFFRILSDSLEYFRIFQDFFQSGFFGIFHDSFRFFGRSF